MHYLVVLVFVVTFVKCEDVLSFVNPLIGTGGGGWGIGGDPPGPQVPFGLVRLSPDTINWENIFINWDHFGGYYYNDDRIRVFSHTHMVGPGITDYGNIGVFPVTIDQLDDQFLKDYGYRSTFTHDGANERSEPAYYQVKLKRYDINVELTATKYAGVHRYTFPISSQPNQRYILFPISHTLHPHSCNNSDITIVTNATAKFISGHILNMGAFSNFNGGVNIYFYAFLDADFDKFGTWNNGRHTDSSKTVQGTDVGAYIYGFTNYTVTLYVGISFVSVDQAKKNLYHDLEKISSKSVPTFEQVKVHSQQLWRNELGRVKIYDANPVRDNLVKFYTALYHASMAPTTFNDADGTYLGFDHKLHKLNGSKAFYTDLSLWDVHRTQMPLLSWFYPDRMHDVARSLILMTEQGGFLPMWPFANLYTCNMVGSHAIVVIMDAMLKTGPFSEHDKKVAYEGMVRAATQRMKTCSREYVDEYVKLGFIPYDRDTYAASKTLEYAYDDFILGTWIAKFIGNMTEAKIFIQRGKNYKNVFNDENKFFCPKSLDGRWHCPWGPQWINPADNRYVEGDAWHYRFFVPHDPEGLIESFNDTNLFVEQLEKFLYWSEYDPSNFFPNPYYWAGNEHNLFSVWMFNWANRNDLTQKYSRWLLDHKYGIGPDGLPGNDDYGTMSAWFVWAALGFYPITGTTKYAMGSPIFEKYDIRLSDSCTLSVNAQCIVKGHENCIYVKSVRVNGVAFKTPFFDHEDLTCKERSKNIVIEFEMDINPHPTLVV
jgi:predicted alpha-1,2-mannosidase